MKRSNIAGILIAFIVAFMMPSTVFAANMSDAMYTEDFVKATDYEKYSANDDSLKDELIWIEGQAIDYDQVSSSIIVKTNEGRWAAFCGKEGTDNYKALVQEAVGKNVRVFGKYSGVSAELKLPQIDFIQEDVHSHAYRLESTDNDFRITYVDYILTIPELDSENTYGNFTFSDSTNLVKEQDDNTLFYYFTTKVPAFILIHEEELTDKAYDGLSDERILDIFEEYYTRNSKYIVRKDRVNIGGTQGIVCESSFDNSSMPSSMCLYCYMTIVNRHYYYFGFTQPYLASESLKRFIPAMLEGARYDDSNANSQPGEDTSATEADDKQSLETQDQEAPNIEETIDIGEAQNPGETSNSEGMTNPGEQQNQGEMTTPGDKQDEDLSQNMGEPQTPESTQGQEQTDGKKVPTRAEVVGKYTMTIELIKDDGKTRKETGENVYWGDDELKEYDESTGVCVMKRDNFAAVVTFEYDKEMNIVCHGTISAGNSVGSVIGIKTSY